jgi:hypothetical protein
MKHNYAARAFCFYILFCANCENERTREEERWERLYIVH